MAGSGGGITDEEMDSLLSTFDHIQEVIRLSSHLHHLLLFKKEKKKKDPITHTKLHCHFDSQFPQCVETYLFS